jgi:hypothetical protein
VLGDNQIKITAADPGGTGAIENITAFKPEHSYTVSGILSTYADIAIGYNQSGIELELDNGTKFSARPA